MTTLSDKVCVITGASKGMGRAFAEALVAEGARVALLARPSEELEKVVAQLGDTAIAVPCDVSNAQQVDAAIARTVEHFGRIDTLVNNAAAMILTNVEEATTEDIERQIAVNLSGSIYCSRAAIPHLRAAGGGDLVFITSEGAQTPFPYLSLYGATKAGTEALAAGLRSELGKQGTRVTVIRSGVVEGSSLRATTPQDVQDRFFKAMGEGGHLAAVGKEIRRETMAKLLVSLLGLPADVNVDLVVSRGRPL